MTPINEQKLEREDESGTPARPQRDPQDSRQRGPAPKEPPQRRAEVHEDEEEDEEEEE